MAISTRDRERIWLLINRGDYDRAGDYIVNHASPDELAEIITYALQALETAIIGTTE